MFIFSTKSNPATAYEIAKESFTPTSKIYEVLSKLLEKEVIIEIVDNNKKKYTSVDPKNFIEKYKTSINEMTNYLSSSLVSLNKEKDVSYIINIKDYNYLINKSIKMMINSEKSLLISIWNYSYGVIDHNTFCNII